jgi:hypothetical protein
MTRLIEAAEYLKDLRAAGAGGKVVNGNLFLTVGGSFD